MEEKVFIHIYGTPADPAMQDQGVELITTGTLCRQDAVWVLEYSERGLFSDADATTRVELHDGWVYLQRLGKAHTVLIFEKHKTYMGSVPAPDGFVEMSVLATDLQIQLDAAQGTGRVDIEYALRITSMGTANRFLIRFHTIPTRPHAALWPDAAQRRASASAALRPFKAQPSRADDLPAPAEGTENP